MKFYAKKIYFILFFISAILFTNKLYSKESKIEYSQENISNYLLGTISFNQSNNKKSYKYLGKAKSLKDFHTNYNINFIRTLVLLDKFKEAYDFAEDTWDEEKTFFEGDLLLGIDAFKKKKYRKAEKHFERLNPISSQNLVFADFLGNVLISWVKASENDQKNSFKFYDKIPNRFSNLKQIQNSFLQCYFDTSKTETNYLDLLKNNEYDFSRYNYFLINYLISKNKISEANKILDKNIDNLHSRNLLIKQTGNFLKNNNKKKITNFFSCKDPKDNIAEIFYVIANLYSSEENYQLSNFYLKISMMLNDNFLPNAALLAENYYNLKKYELSKKIYYSLKSIGNVYSWYSSKNIATIIYSTDGKEKSFLSLEKDFNLIADHNLEHLYEIANIYKDNAYYEKSIKYYSLALNKAKKDDPIISKILYRRGTSYERLDEWDKAETDLLESIKISPDQALVLNYLAYSWIEKRINLDKSLKMLKRATELKKNDGYIIDSLGWAHYMNKNYEKAEKFLQRAVELMPSDPIINDHYADVLWKQNKMIQARYFWKHALELEVTDEETIKKINKKIISGVN